MKKLSKKKLEGLVSSAFYKHSFCIQIPIMDLSKIYKAGEVAVLNGQDLDAAMIAAIELYKCKEK